MDSNELEFPVIRNTSVVDSVKDWITDQMIKGNLRPGSKLPTEAELSQRLGVGRNSVREAIKQMEAYGVLYIKRAEGTFVAEQFDPKMLSPILRKGTFHLSQIPMRCRASIPRINMLRSGIPAIRLG